jgi:voltage-gated potassium channel
MLLQGDESVVLEQISCENIASCFAGKSIKELDVANTTGANIIGLKRKDKSFLINPHKNTPLNVSDKLFALGTREQISQLIATITNEDS